jgi:uncharacterized membrane protein
LLLRRFCKQSIRRVVLFHSVVSFLFYSTVISAVINLFTSG